MIQVSQEHLFRTLSQPPRVRVCTYPAFWCHFMQEAILGPAFQGQNCLLSGAPTLSSSPSRLASRLPCRQIPAFQLQSNAIGWTHPLVLVPVHTD